MFPRSRDTACPSSCKCQVPQKRGRRECQVFRCTRSLVCRKKTHELVTTGEAETSRFPARWCYRLLRALPGVHDLFSHRRARIIARALGTSPGVPGPHAFAVRHRIARPTIRPAATASRAPRLVTIAIRPSCRGGTVWVMPLIWGSDKAKYFGEPG